MRKNMLRMVFLMVALLVSMVSFNAFAEEVEEVAPTASADVSVLNKYIWRGYQLSDDSIVIQPSATVEYKGFSLNLWGNLDTSYDDADSTTDDSSDFNETDLTLAYDTSVGDFDLGVGYIYYALEGVDSEELYVSVCAAAVPLAPTFTVYKDIKQFIGWYLNLGISHSFDLGNDMSLDLGGSAGYYYSEDDDTTEYDSNLNPKVDDRYKSFHDGQISIGMTIPLDKYFTLSPMVAYTFPLTGSSDDHLAGSNGYGNDSDFIVAGVTLSLAF